MGNQSGRHYVPRTSGTGSNSRRVHWGGAGLPVPPGKPILIPVSAEDTPVFNDRPEASVQRLPAPPGKPILIPVSTEDTQPDVIGIRWERSPSNGGSAIVGYQVEHRRMGSPYWVRSSPTLCSFPELTLSGLEPGWRYQFRVRARNSLGPSEPSELSDILTVTLQRSAASAPRFDVELKDTVALENDQAEFIVQFSGTPLPKISWFKDGFEIFSSRRTRIITENGKSTLLIHQTALNDEGEIKCTATNKAGHVSTKAKLVLEAPPKIRLPRQYEDGLLFEQDETIRLKVSLAGRPLPAVTWYHDGEVVAADEGHILEKSDSGECALRIAAAKRRDRGEYTVKATNKLGEDVASFLVTVTDRPAAPGKAMIAMTLGRSVTLSWNEPEDDGGCKIGTYIVEYYRIGWDMWLKAATCRQPTTTLGELIEGSEYRFRVKAENPYGVSDPSDESDVVFIPDPKRGINSPPTRPDKTQSQREIHRGRGVERRDASLVEPTKRTRSLTREEAIRGVAGDGFEGGPPTRSASAHRLAGTPTPPSRPSRADSRVTFADTVFLHVEKPLEDSSTPTRPKSKRDKTPTIADDEQNSSAKKDRVQIPTGLEKIESTPKIVRQPTFDDSGGRSFSPEARLSPPIRDRSPSPLPSIKVHEIDSARIEEKPAEFSRPTSPREEEEDSLAEEDDEERSLRGSSEFMLVLYPEEDPALHSPTSRPRVPTDLEPLERSRLTRSAFSEGEAEDDDEDEDLVAPPMSLSLPELFSANHQVVEVLREAVSSTELLHERAMERFYRAVALEEAEMAKKNEASSTVEEKRGSGTSPLPIESSGLSPSSLRLRTTRLRRRPSSTGTPGQVATKAAWNRRRSSEGQASPTKLTRGLPAALLLPVPQLVASDPNLPKLNSDIEDAELRAGMTRLQADLAPPAENSSGAERSHLHRWDEKSMPLVPTDDFEAERTGSGKSLHRQLSEKTPDRELAPKSLEAQKRESLDDEPDDEIQEEEEEEEESDSSEDLKLLKSRILAQPIVDEEDTYHPRGRPTPHVPSPEPPGVEQRGPMTPNNVNQQPKSILKKRTDEEPVPVNRFGRPIPPEMPILERQRKRIEDEEPEDLPENFEPEDAVTLRKRSLTSTPEAARSPLLSEMDQENANLLSVAEVARSRRRLSTPKPALPTKTSFEEEEELQARMAVIDHYTEIVREYSMAHSVHPPIFQRSNTVPATQDVGRRHHDPVDLSGSDRTNSVSPVPIARPGREVSVEKSAPVSILRKDEVNLRKNSAGSRATTPAPEAKTTREARSRRVSRNESPAPRSRNVSTERPGTGSRSSSRTRNREPSQDRSSGAAGTKAKTRNRETSRDRAAPSSRSSSKTRNREPSQEKSAAPRLRKERSVSQSRTSSRAGSKDRYRAVDLSPSDSEASSRVSGRRKSNAKKVERISRATSRSRRVSTVDAEARNVVAVVVDERLVAKKVRSTISYVTDLTLFLAAVYVYFFKKEILAVPLIGLLLYRRIQEDVHGWMPKWWRSAARKR